MRIPKNDRNEFAKSLAYDCNNTKTTKLSCYALKYNTFCPFNDKMCKEITQDDWDSYIRYTIAMYKETKGK